MKSGTRCSLAGLDVRRGCVRNAHNPAHPKPTKGNSGPPANLNLKRLSRERKPRQTGGMHPNEQKQQFSFAYLRAIASAAGYAVTRPDIDDDSVDLTFSARGGDGTIRSPRLDAQVKCTADPVTEGGDFTFRLPLKNYDDLRPLELQAPRILIVTYVPRNQDDWIRQTDQELVLRRCAYWGSLRGQPDHPVGAARNPRVPVLLSRERLFSRSALRQIMHRLSEGGVP